MGSRIDGRSGGRLCISPAVPKGEPGESDSGQRNNKEDEVEQLRHSHPFHDRCDATYSLHQPLTLNLLKFAVDMRCPHFGFSSIPRALKARVLGMHPTEGIK